MHHITLNACTGDDYAVTQRVMGCFYKLLKDKVDGVCYFSRHISTTDFCYAVWDFDEEKFVDAGIKDLTNYEDSEWLPSACKFESITAQELLEGVLRFNIVPL